MLKIITIILAIIVMGLSFYSLILPDVDRLLIPITQLTFALLGLFLGLLALKEKHKIPAIVCFSSLGFWLMVIFAKSIFN